MTTGLPSGPQRVIEALNSGGVIDKVIRRGRWGYQLTWPDGDKESIAPSDVRKALATGEVRERGTGIVSAARAAELDAAEKAAADQRAAAAAKARITYPTFDTPEQERAAVNRAFERVLSIERMPASGSIGFLNRITRDEVRALRLHAEGSKDTPYQMSVRLREYRKDGTIMPFGRIVEGDKLIDNPAFEAANAKREKTSIEIGWAEQRERREIAQKQWDKDREAFGGKSRAWLLKQAKARGIDVPRGTSDQEIINDLARYEINSKIDKAPPGSTYGQTAELTEELRREAVKTLNARKDDYVGGLADVAGLYQQSREAAKTGTVPVFTLRAAQRIVSREGLDIRDGDGQDRMRQLLNMPDEPGGDAEVLHANELGFGDLVTLGGFGGHVGTIVEHADGKVSITTFGLNGQTFTIPGDQKVKTRVAERRGLIGTARAARREVRLAQEEHQAKVDAAWSTMRNAPSVYEQPADGRPSVREVSRTAGFSKHPERWSHGRTIDAPAGHSNKMISDVGYMDDIMVRASLYNPPGPGQPYRAEVFDYSNGSQIETFESMDLKEIVGKLDKIFSKDDGGPMARAEGIEARFEVRSAKTGAARHQVWRITNTGEERQLTAMSDRREAERHAERLGLAEAKRLGRPDSTDTAWGRVAAGGVAAASTDDLRLAGSKPGLPTAKAREIRAELDRRERGLPAETPETAQADPGSLAKLAGTHNYETLKAGGFTRGVEARVGDVAVAHSRGEMRQGVVTKVTPTKVELSYTTRGAINENPGSPRVTRKTVNREDVWIKAAGREKVAPASAGSGRVQSPARRGDLVLVERKRSAYVQGKGHEERTEYEFGEVTSVDREGKVKTYTDASGSTKKVEPGQRALVSKAEVIDVDAVMEAARRHTYPQSDTPMPVASIEDAVKLARPHAADKARVAAKLEAKRAAEPRNRKVTSLKPGDRILYKDPRGRGEAELDIIGEPRMEGGVLKVRARNPNVNREGDLVFKGGAMAKVLPATAGPEAEPTSDPAAALEGLSGQRDWNSGMLTLGAALTRSLTGGGGAVGAKDPTRQQEESVDIALKAIADELGRGGPDDVYELGPEDVTPDVVERALRRVAPAPAGQTAGITAAARNNPNLVKLRPARVDRPRDTDDAHGATVNPGDRVTMASDLHNRTGEHAIVLDVGVSEKNGAAMSTVRWDGGVVEQVLTPNLVKDPAATAERVYSGILARELEGDPRARQSLRGQPSTMDKIMSPDFLNGNFRYKAAVLRREAVRHRGQPLADKLTAAQRDIERLGGGHGEPGVIDRLIGQKAPRSSEWTPDRETAGARLARERGIEPDTAMLNSDIVKSAGAWSVRMRGEDGRLAGSQNFGSKRDAEAFIVDARETRAKIASMEDADEQRFRSHAAALLGADPERVAMADLKPGDQFVIRSTIKSPNGTPRVMVAHTWNGNTLRVLDKDMPVVIPVEGELGLVYRVAGEPITDDSVRRETTDLTREIRGSVTDGQGLDELAGQRRSAARADLEARVRMVGSDPLVARAADLDAELARYERTASERDQAVQRLRAIADDPTADPSRRVAAGQLAEKVRLVGKRDDDVAPQRRELEALRADADALARIEDAEAEAFRDEVAEYRATEERAGAAAGAELAEAFGGEEHLKTAVAGDLRAGDLRDEYLRARRVLQVRKRQLEGAEARLSAAKTALYDLQSKEGREALQTKIKGDEFRLNGLRDDVMVNELKADRARAELEVFAAKGRAAAAANREWEERYRTSPAVLDREDMKAALDKIRESLVGDLERINVKAAVSSARRRLKKQYAIPGDSKIRNLPAGERAVAERAVSLIEGAEEQRVTAINNDRQIAATRALIEQGGLRPATVSALNSMMARVAVDRGGEGVTAEQSPGVQALTARRDDALLAWQAIKPGSNGALVEDPPRELWFGLPVEQQESVIIMSRTVGVGAAERLSISLREVNKQRG